MSAIERGAWTEERLDDLAESMRTGFARIDQDLRDLRAEMHQGFASLRQETRGEIAELRASVNRTNLALIVGFLSVIAAILARGG